MTFFDDDFMDEDDELDMEDEACCEGEVYDVDGDAYEALDGTVGGYSPIVPDFNFGDFDDEPFMREETLEHYGSHDFPGRHDSGFSPGLEYNSTGYVNLFDSCPKADYGFDVDYSHGDASGFRGWQRPADPVDAEHADGLHESADVADMRVSGVGRSNGVAFGGDPRQDWLDAQTDAEAARREYNYWDEQVRAHEYRGEPSAVERKYRAVAEVKLNQALKRGQEADREMNFKPSDSFPWMLWDK